MEPTITKEDTPEGGRYLARVEGNADVAHLDFTDAGEGVISADHTIVPKSMGGQGVGSALVQAMVADARAQGVRIRPVCSFVVAQAQRHPEWADVLA